MVKLRVLFLVLVLSFSASAQSGGAGTMAVVSNLVNSLNYNRHEDFIKDGSPEWRKRMSRSSFKKLHTQMLNYIGHIVSWKPVSKSSGGKVETYTFRLVGNNESIGLIMRVQMYQHKDKILVHSVSFVKR